jgi:hypothetical protein
VLLGEVVVNSFKVVRGKFMKLFDIIGDFKANFVNPQRGKLKIGLVQKGEELLGFKFSIP